MRVRVGESESSGVRVRVRVRVAVSVRVRHRVRVSVTCENSVCTGGDSVNKCVCVFHGDHECVCIRDISSHPPF